jgi:hypothetical protein
MYSSINDTAVQIWHSVTLDLIFERLWLPLKGISIEKTYINKLSFTIPITFTHKIWGLSRDRFLSQRCHWHRCEANRRFHSRFSSRIRSHIQKGFNPCIRGLGGVDLWKKPEVENLVSGSLLALLHSASLLRTAWEHYKYSWTVVGVQYNFCYNNSRKCPVKDKTSLVSQYVWDRSAPQW